MRHRLPVAAFLLAAVALHAARADDAPSLQPGSLFSVSFPDMPPTLSDQCDHNGIKPRMTVFLPQNYDPQRRHPVLIYLSGGSGGTGGNPDVARRISDEKDYVCVNLPLFKEKVEGSGDARLLLGDADYRFAWPLYRTMLDKLAELVPNLDPAHRILGGFSNGAHMTAGLLDDSDGEVSQRFSAFFFVAGGGRLRHYDQLKDRRMLMLYGDNASPKRIQEIHDAAVQAGAKVTLHVMKGVGHAFPPSEYPAVGDWLRGPASE
jgi:predicted esterase